MSISGTGLGSDSKLDSFKQFEALSSSRFKSLRSFVPDLKFNLDGYKADKSSPLLRSGDRNSAVKGAPETKSSRDLEKLLADETNYEAKMNDYRTRPWSKLTARKPDFSLSEQEKQYVYAKIRNQINSARTPDEVNTLFAAYNGRLIIEHFQTVFVEACREKLEGFMKPGRSIEYFVPRRNYNLEDYDNTNNRSLATLEQEETTYQSNVSNYNKRSLAERVKAPFQPAPVFKPLNEDERQMVFAEISKQLTAAKTNQAIEAVNQKFQEKLFAAHVQDRLAEQFKMRKQELLRAGGSQEAKVGEGEEQQPMQDSAYFIDRLSSIAAVQKSSPLSPQHEGWFSGASSARRKSFDQLTTFNYQDKEQVRKDLKDKINKINDTDSFVDTYNRYMTQPYVTDRRIMQRFNDSYYSYTRIEALNGFREKALTLVKGEHDSAEKQKLIKFFLAHDAFNERHNNKYSYLSKAAINNTVRGELLKIERAAATELVTTAPAHSR